MVFERLGGVCLGVVVGLGERVRVFGVWVCVVGSDCLRVDGESLCLDVVLGGTYGGLC